MELVRMVPSSRRRPIAPVLAALCLVVAAACGDEADDAAGPQEQASGTTPTAEVLATTSIWADVTEQVACGEIEVESIVPAGADAHEFEPSVRETDAVTGADLVVANGLDLEEGLTDTLDAAAEAGATVVPVAEGVTLVEGGHAHSEEKEAHSEEEGHSHSEEDGHSEEEGHSHSEEDGHSEEEDGHSHSEEEAHSEEDGHSEEEAGHSEEEGHSHDHGGVDPHVWMDPQRVAEAVPTIADALIETADTGLDAEQIERCAAEYVEQLDELTAELTEMFSGLGAEQRRLVTDHESLGYLADGFGLEVIGTVIPSTSSLGETNPRELEELATAMESAGVTRIYAASTGASDVAAALGDRLGGGGEVEVVELYTESLGEPGGEADSYLAMMRVNGERISAP